MDLFGRLAGLFKSKERELSHLASGWLALEAAKLVAPLYRQHWKDCPRRYPDNLRWAHSAMWRHLTGQDVRPRYLRLATLKAFMAAGGAVKSGRPYVSIIATVTVAASKVVDQNEEEWKHEFAETMTFFADCADEFGRPDMVTRLDQIRDQIASLDQSLGLASRKVLPIDVSAQLQMDA